MDKFCQKFKGYDKKSRKVRKDGDMIFLLFLIVNLNSAKTQFAKSSPVIDGMFDGNKVYNQYIRNFVKIKPTDTEIPSESIKVYSTYDNINLYIFFKVYQKGEITSSTVRRDHNFSLDDWVEVVISPFGESKESYSFMVNPRGTKWDAHFTEDGAGGGKEWDGRWECKTMIYRGGWNAEFSLPFRLFKYSDKDTIWRINFYRYTKNKDELDSWSNIGIENNRYRVSMFGYLIIHPPRKKVRNVIIPYISYMTSDRILKEGIDMKTILFSKFSFSGTYKPDFCQVEPDMDKINLSKEAEIYLPEKRPFFLEDFGAFDMDIPVFYTRRIIDFDKGIKFSTHLKGLKAVSFYTKYDSLQERIKGLRLKKYGIFGNLDAGGMIIDYRDNLSNEISYAGDTRVRFLKNANLLLNYALIRNNKDEGLPDALESWFSYANKHFYLSLGYKDYQKDFAPVLGFITRNDIKGPIVNISYRTYLSKNLKIKIKTLFNKLRNHEDEKVLYGWRGNIEATLNNSYGFYFYNNRFGHRYGEDYFQNNFYDSGIFCDLGDKISFTTGFASGDFYGGKMEYPYFSVFLHPLTNINLSFSTDYSKVRYGDTIEKELISIVKCEYKVSSFLSFRIFYQKHSINTEKTKVFNSLIKIRLLKSLKGYIVYDREDKKENIYIKAIYEYRM